MQPSYHFRTQQNNSRHSGLEEKVIAQTFRTPANEFNYERNVARRLRSQQNQYDYDEEISLRNIYHEPPSLCTYTTLFEVLAPLRAVIREFTTLIYRQKESYLTFDEFYVLLSKNKVCADPELTLKWFRELDQDNDNLLSVADLQNILGQDLISLNLVELSEPEMLLRFALEIFHHLSDDCFELDLKRAMHFIKFSMKEEIDFLETIEMFGFVQDIYYGQVRTRVSLQTFLQKVCPQLKKCVSKVVLRKCHQTANSHQPKPKRQGLHARNVNSVEQVLKQQQQLGKQPLQTQNDNHSIKVDLEKLIQRNFHLNLEVEVQEEVQVDEQEQIVNFLKENRPKQRGWLQRLSTTKANKWSLLFFQIDPHPKTLKAVKPEGVKKTFDVCTHEFELVRQPPGHRKTNSLKDSANFNQATQTLAATFEYLIITVPKQKPFILRSYDSAELLLMINEYRQNVKSDKHSDESFSYSGIVNVAISNVKEYQLLEKVPFKEHLVVMKEGKLLLYGCVVKHSLPLDQLSIDPEQPNLPFIPSHPYPFALIQREKQAVQEYLQVNKRKVERQLDDDGEVAESVIMWQIDEEEQDDSDTEGKKQQRSMFSQLMDRFKSKKEPVIKETRIVLSAESELKRRQWVFSINYYRTSKGREQQEFMAHRSNKSSYQMPSSFSQFQTPLPSQFNHQQSPLRSSMFRSLHSQSNQIFIGGNHTHINMNVLNLGSDEDYYDIFRDNQQRSQAMQEPVLARDQHCHTDPNEQKELQVERLVTLPSKQGNSIRSWRGCMINSTTNLELWQRFLLSFFKYLGQNRRQFSAKHEIVFDETQEPSVQKLYNRKLNVCKPK